MSTVSTDLALPAMRLEQLGLQPGRLRFELGLAERVPRFRGFEHGA